jgi:hypothetical protein
MFCHGASQILGVDPISVRQPDFQGNAFTELLADQAWISIPAIHI